MAITVIKFILKNWRVFSASFIAILLFGYIGILKYQNASQSEKIGQMQIEIDALDEKLYYSEQSIIALQEKIKADSQTIKNLQKIKENIQNAHNTKDDGAVAPVLLNTLNGLHALQNRK